MRQKTLTIEIAAPVGRVIEFLSRPESMPKWAFHYCRGLVREGKTTKLLLSSGDQVYFKARVQQDVGVVDLCSGPTLETNDVLPMRVLALGEDRSLVAATMIFPAAFPEEDFSMLVGFLREELDRLAELVPESDAQSV